MAQLLAPQSRIEPIFPTIECRAAISDVVLLGGTIRSTSLSRTVGRSILDLPVAENCTVMEEWQRHGVDLVDAGFTRQSSIRLLTDRESLPPRLTHIPFGNGVAGASIRLQTDHSALRGTAGVLRDALYGSLSDDDYVVVANAAQVLLEPLADLIDALRGAESDVALFVHLDGTPAGLMLMRVGCLALVPEVGYCDLKEQALPLIAKTREVRVLYRRRPVGTPVRSLTEYISALQRVQGTVEIDNPFAETWAPSFGIVESDTYVHPTASVFDSVVLRGGRVERGATVVRSVICPGGVARRNQMISDRLIGTEEKA